jgi:hypothetical protein
MLSVSPRCVSLFAVAALVVIGGSCGKSPTSPQQLPGSGNVTILRILTNVPASIAPGATMRLTATAIKSDGTAEDITNSTAWSSTNSPVVEIRDGIATGGQRGESQVNARYLNISNTRVLMVMPDGTFKLIGQVADSGAALEDATVAVLAGTGAGQTAVTSFRGFYALYGVAGDVRLEAKKAGYSNLIVEANVVAVNQRADFSVALAGGRPNAAGRYELTVTADPDCAARLPAEARRRTYIATVMQNGADLSVAMTGAEYIVTGGTGDQFKGRVTFDGVRFLLMDEEYYYYTGFAIIEHFSTTALIVNGLASAAPTSNGYAGRLSGSIGVASRPTYPFYPLSAGCTGQNHGFEMRRQ